MRRSLPRVARRYRVGWLFAAVPLKDRVVLIRSIPSAEPSCTAYATWDISTGRTWCSSVGLRIYLERIGEFAAELVSFNPDVIITGGGDFMAQALRRLTKTVPIISPYGDDPVGAGLVASLGHPGGTVTGFLALPAQFETKRLQLLKEAVPKAIRIGFLAMKDIWEGPVGKALRDAAPMLAMTLIHVEHASSSYVEAFARMTQGAAGCVFRCVPSCELCQQAGRSLTSRLNNECPGFTPTEKPLWLVD